MRSEIFSLLEIKFYAWNNDFRISEELDRLNLKRFSPMWDGFKSIIQVSNYK